jgi:DNA modification methylase
MYATVFDVEQNESKPVTYKCKNYKKTVSHFTDEQRTIYFFEELRSQRVMKKKQDLPSSRENQKCPLEFILYPLSIFVSSCGNYALSSRGYIRDR